MRARRLLILLVVPAFILAALVAERAQDDQVGVVADRLDRLMPVVAGPGARSATWYCAAGTASGPEGVAEQTVLLENAGSEARTAVVTAFGDAGQQGSTTLELPAASRTGVEMSSLVTAPWAGVLVEVDGGEVAAQHVVSGPNGRATGPCASTVAPTWYLPTGTTVLGVSHQLVLFNPFPDEAVVDLTFETETDTRTPPELQGLVVPGRSVKVVDVSAVVTVREQLATSVVARSGLVVAEQIEIVAPDSDLPAGVALLLGAPAPAPTWYLPAGPPLVEGRDVAVVVFNPGDAPAEVDVQVLIDDAAQQGVVEPFELTVRPGQYEVVDLRQDQRVPTDVGWAAYAQSRNGVPVVAARVERARGEVSPSGVATTLGSPLMASRWEVPLGAVPEVGPVGLVAANPSIGDEVTVTVSVVRDGSSTPAPNARSVPVPAGGRVALDLGGVEAADGTSLRIDASGPVVVEAGTTFPPGGLSWWMAAPVEGTLSSLPVAVTDATTSPTVVLDGAPVDPAPSDTAGPGTGPSDTAPGESTATSDGSSADPSSSETGTSETSTSETTAAPSSSEAPADGGGGEAPG